MERRDILQALPFFAGLSERDWEKVIDLFSERQYQKDDYIFLEGEAPEALYIIRTGKVSCIRYKVAYGPAIRINPVKSTMSSGPDIPVGFLINTGCNISGKCGVAVSV